LERGDIPVLLSSYDGRPHEIAAALAQDLPLMTWSTGAKQEVAPLIARCEALARPAQDAARTGIPHADLERWVLERLSGRQPGGRL